jgi:hypothetical protein
MQRYVCTFGMRVWKGEKRGTHQLVGRVFWNNSEADMVAAWVNFRFEKWFWSSLRREKEGEKREGALYTLSNTGSAKDGEGLVEALCHDLVCEEFCRLTCT